MKIEVFFNQDEQRWEVLSPAGITLENLSFKFPVACVDGLDGAASYPTGKPEVTAIGYMNGKKFKTTCVSIKNGF